MKITIDKKAFNMLRNGDSGTLPRTSYDYKNYVGDGLDSAIVVATALWIARQFPEARLAVQDEEGNLDFQHPIVQLFRYPNDWYGEGTLRMALSMDYTINGNGYLWIQPRNKHGIPQGLIWIPSFAIEPKGTKSDLVTHYEYQVSESKPIKIPIDDMIHFRNGLDPRNQKLGFSPLRCLLREIFTDDEAANFTAAILRNMGYPGLMISPAAENDEISPSVRSRIKRYFTKVFTGDKRGEVLVTSGRLKLDTLDVDLSKVGIQKLRAIPESRVTAVFGIPAAVIGFLTGMETTKVGATMKQMREQAYENSIIPMQYVFAEEISKRLIPEYEINPENHVVFDNSKVRILQEDETNMSKRITNQYKAGIITREEARKKLGY